MIRKNKIATGAGMAIVLMMAFATLSQATSLNPPCPQIGFADGCDAIITLNANGTASISLTGQSAYDGDEDQLVGIINNSTSSVGTISISGSNIFGFDGDGAGEPGTGCLITSGNPYPCLSGGPFGSTGYEGPGTSFTVTDSDNGSVNFSPGLAANGGTAWFSLEEAPSTGGFTVTGVSSATPEPETWLLLGTGLIGLLVFRKKMVAACSSST